MSDERNTPHEHSNDKAIAALQARAAQQKERIAEARKKEDQERLEKFREANKLIAPKGFIEVSVGEDVHFVAVRHIVSFSKAEGNLTLLICTESIGRQGNTVHVEQSPKELINRINEARKS